MYVYVCVYIYISVTATEIEICNISSPPDSLLGPPLSVHLAPEVAMVLTYTPLISFACSGIFYKWNRIICILLCLTSFTQHNVCEIHTYYCILSILNNCVIWIASRKEGSSSFV